MVLKLNRSPALTHVLRSAGARGFAAEAAKSNVGSSLPSNILFIVGCGCTGKLLQHPHSIEEFAETVKKDVGVEIPAEVVSTIKDAFTSAQNLLPDVARDFLVDDTPAPTATEAEPAPEATAAPEIEETAATETEVIAIEAPPAEVDYNVQLDALRAKEKAGELGPCCLKDLVEKKKKLKALIKAKG